MSRSAPDIIPIEAARTLDGLFRERVRRSPDAVAYRYFSRHQKRWADLTWMEMHRRVGRWRAALAREGLSTGDRVAIMLRNCPQWVLYDQAALSLGLVVVPLYPNDRAENLAYIVQNSGATLLLIEGAEHWDMLRPVREQLAGLRRVLTLDAVSDDGGQPPVEHVDQWLALAEGPVPDVRNHEPDQLATIVYTSGTTGRPKGVMLSHHNIVWNANSAMESAPGFPEDLFLSFLPLSHTFERTVGYYLPMMAGATVAYARSIPDLAEDLLAIRPTVLISVPRIFERVYDKLKAQLQEKPPLARRLFHGTVRIGWQRFEHAQGRGPWKPSFLLWPILNALVANRVISRLGGRIRLSICGGAPLSERVARVFIGLGLPLLQGYGLTETSPVISVNCVDSNDPASVGIPIRDLEVRVGEKNELLIRSPGVMLGYWQNDEATKQMIDREGWLRTGDKVEIRDNHIYITGRLKDILVMANGEKVAPADLEAAVADDTLIDHAMVIGERRPYVSAIVVLNPDQWPRFARARAVDPEAPETLEDPRVENAIIARIEERLREFPSYAQIRRVALTLEPWSVDNTLLTPTLKLRRHNIMSRYKEQVKRLYEGH